MDKKVVIINQSSGYLMIDIANAFASEYNQVVLITGTLKSMERDLNSGVKIQKIVKYNRSSKLNRLFTWCWGSFQIFLLLIFKYRQYEVIYTTNPPIAYLTSLFFRNKFSIIIWDIYPDSLKNIGIGENNLLYRRWVTWNRILFKKAKGLFTLSEGMAKQISCYIENEKIKVISNWAGSDKLTPIKKEGNPFIRDYNLNGKFIVQYSGNIGFTHNVETIIEAAKELEQEKSICFLIIGEGGKKKKLMQMVQNYNLNNCIFMSWLPTNIFPYSLASADVAVITLNEESSDTSVPSKTFNYLAVGSPLLCIANENSELSQLVSKYHNGICCSKDKIKNITEFILRLSKDKELHNRLSSNSVSASKDFTVTNAKKYL